MRYRLVMAPNGSRELEEVSARTLDHYQRNAEAFREGTRDHDVSQNYQALLGAIETTRPFTLLDLGCGPGRDLAHFHSLGHHAIGLDGSTRFVEMARAQTGCEVWHQDFLRLELPSSRFDGIFANASLFHVPRAELSRVLLELARSLVPRGVLFASNPHGHDVEGWNGDRYGSYLRWETWRDLVLAAGFDEVEHYYRPEGKARGEHPWLASVWRVGRRPAS
jgi:SAM-dependent methyltransferase